MAFSRWSNSAWYTYWSASSYDDKHKENQVFEICDEKFFRFTYEQLTTDMDSCLQKVKDYFEGFYTEEEYMELKGYMLQFLDRMDDEFRDK